MIMCSTPLNDDLYLETNSETSEQPASQSEKLIDE
jgi:hypothetical protein